MENDNVKKDFYQQTPWTVRRHISKSSHQNIFGNLLLSMTN